MNEKINITKMDGATVSADIIAFIENTTSNKKYVYYTLNETVGVGPSSTVKIYVSKIRQNDPTLDAPITEDDWKMLKDVMSDSIKGSVSSSIKYLPLGDLQTPVSVSDRAIAMPTSYDYINKQRGLYAQAVASMAPVEPVAAQEVPEEVVPSQSEVTPTPQEEVVPQPEAVPESQENIPEAPVGEPVLPSEPVSAPSASETPEVAPVPEMITPVEPAVPPVVEQAPETSAPVEPQPVEPMTLNQALDKNTLVAGDVSEEEETTGTAAVLEPIDLSEIETKYSEMIDAINKLKEKELEAAKRYNATLELNSMHTEQHVNYVQSDLKQNTLQTETPAPIEAVMPEAVVPQATPSVNPTPVSPVTPGSAPASSTDIETNWFDMPNN